MTPEQKEELKKLSEQMPPEAVNSMRTVLQKIYTEHKVPFDKSHLEASLVMCHLILPNIPPIHANFISSAMLLLYRLQQELETGFITSPIQPKKDETIQM